MSDLVTDAIASLTPYESGKPIEELARELGVHDAIKLASNENPLGPSPKAIEAARAALADVNRYPDAAAYRLREKLAAFHHVAMDEIIHGNGSNELIELLIRTFTTERDHIVYAWPSFVVYRLASLAHNTPFTAVPLKDHAHDLEAMAAAVTPQTRLMFVANPNNPTGTHVGRESLRRLLTSVPSDVIIVLDEAYIQYADADDFPDSLELRSTRERLVTLRTFSKIYGLASFRVGYAIGPRRLIDYMNRVRAPFNVGAVSQAAAMAALDDTDHVEKSVRINREQRAVVSDGFRELGLDVAPSQTNFVFVDAGRDGREVYDALLRLGVIVRPMAPGTSFLRVTVGTEAENQRCLAAFKKVLSS